MLLERGANPSLADAKGARRCSRRSTCANQQWTQVPAPDVPHRCTCDDQRLLDAGADVEAKLTGKVAHRGSFDIAGPTSRAARHSFVPPERRHRVMRLLLERGASPKAATDKNETALLLLAGAGWPLGQGYIRSDAEISRRSTCSWASSAWT